MNNAFLSDPKWSPFINPKIQAFTLKRQNDKEISLQNLEKHLEMKIPVELAKVSESYSVNFTDKTIKKHRFQLTPDAPYGPFLVRVKPENGETLNVNLSINYEASSSLEKLTFPVPLDEKKIPALFRKANEFSYIAWKPPSRPIYFDLNVTVTKPFTAQEGSGNKSRAVQVNYTVAIYSVQCMYWDRTKYEWLDTGCKVSKLF